MTSGMPNTGKLILVIGGTTLTVGTTGIAAKIFVKRELSTGIEGIVGI